MLKDILQALVARMLNFVSSRHGKSFETRNDNQIHSARTLAMIFADTVAFTRFVESLAKYPTDQKAVLEKIGVLFGLKTLSFHIGHLYEYSIFSDPRDSRWQLNKF